MTNGTVAPPQQFRNMPPSGLIPPTQAQEPIYENIPLPWAAEGREATTDGKVSKNINGVHRSLFTSGSFSYFTLFCCSSWT